MTHALDTHIRARHAVSSIRGGLFVAPDTPGLHDADCSAGDRPFVAPVLPLTLAKQARDGIARTGAIAPVDSQGRVSMRKALEPLGWDECSRLIVTVRGRTAVVRAGIRDTPTVTAVQADAQGRLCLPPAVKASLGLAPGDQVLAIALPTLGELRLHAALDALQELTGELAAAEALGGDDTPEAEQPPSRSRVRRRFVPEEVP